MVRSSRPLKALAVVALAVPTVAGCGYNTIPTKQERAQAAWADLQSDYQRRADLVPNLVATVQGAAVQERTTLTQVTEARARATGVTLTPEALEDPQAVARFQAAQDEFGSALSRLLVTVEAYPQLQANQNFVILQSQLEGAENRIAISRRDYNEAVRDYNTSLRTFPTVIWAKTAHAGARPMQAFAASAAAQTAPEVRFDLSGAPAQAPAAAPAAQPPAQ